MALLQLVSEEQIAEDSVREYFDDLYKIVCVSERPLSSGGHGELVRTTYIVDWEQLVHLLEDYARFGEDIVEMTAISVEEAHILRGSGATAIKIARA
jgi:hypothetical protein